MDAQRDLVPVQERRCAFAIGTVRPVERQALPAGGEGAAQFLERLRRHIGKWRSMLDAPKQRSREVTRRLTVRLSKIFERFSNVCGEPMEFTTHGYLLVRGSRKGAGVWP